MTPKKSDGPVGVRPGLEECVSGWYRAVGGEARVRGLRPSGYRSQLAEPGPALAGVVDPWDLYCWQIVERALGRLWRGWVDRAGVMDDEVFRSILAHWARTGSICGFRLHVLTAAERGSGSDVWLYVLVRCAWHEAKKAIGECIDRAPAYVAGKEVEVA